MSAASPEQILSAIREHIEAAHETLREIGAAIGTEINGDEDRYRKAFFDLLCTHDNIARDVEALAEAVVKRPEPVKSTAAN